MQIVRSASIYEQRASDERERVIRRFRFWPIWLAGGCVLIALACLWLVRAYGASVWADGGAVMALWAVAVGSVTVLSRATGGSQGEAGENAALRALTSLPDTYTAFSNLKIPGFEKWGDVDILVVGPMGVVVVEVKNFQGHVRVEGEYWSHVSAHGTGLARKSVSGQLRGYVKAVNAFLARNKVVCPVTGIIAINSNAWIEIAAPPPYPLVPYDRLKAQIEAMPEARRPSENERAREALCSVTRGA